jgi:photosynthetic reaction center cytochrome c subunit
VRTTLMQHTVWLPLLAAAALLAGCERPPIDAVQRGYRGLAMEQVYNPRTLAAQIPQNQPPAAMDTGSPDGPKAGQVLQNVKVLGDLSIGQFTAQMAAITAWVSPKEGCVYCHDLANLADDSKYTKVVARRMIEMTQRVNADWKPHVAATGVTCYTCHRGNPVPALTWKQPPAQDLRADFIGNRNGQNLASPSVGLASLPADPVTTYLVKPAAIRVVGKTSLPTGNTTSIQATEGTYALMFHFSGSLGVNCTYCHNSRSFGNWVESPPQRTTAWHGISMVRQLNTEYVLPLGPTLPKSRMGPNGDTPIVACATCHQGAYKPLYGAAMAKDWPGLLSAAGSAAAASAPQ